LKKEEFMELLASLAVLYFLPTLVAMGRGCGFWTVMEMAFFNVLAAWTVIGWIIVLGLALRFAQERQA
jgi:hypothetical protein